MARERLGFALRFAYLDLAPLKRSDLELLKQELETFLAPKLSVLDSRTGLISSEADASRLTSRELVRLQTLVREVLEERFAQSFAELVARDIASVKWSRGVSAHLVPSDIFGHNRCLSRTTQLSLDGPVEACVLILLSLAVVELDCPWVLRCPTRERLFESRRGRKYCSKPCRRASMR